LVHNIHMKKSPVVHFEMPYKDASRVSKFYSSVFGWDMNDAGPNMGGYVVAHTTETDANQLVTTPGTINGGFYNITQTNYTAPSVVVSVTDVMAMIEEVKKAGGKILGEPQDIPGIGLWVSFEDSEGNRVSMLQASKK
jgi:uncharacterized protein